MERRIRRLGIFLIICFVALFIQLNNIQVLKANSLASDPANPAVVAVARSQTRGSILSADGVTLVSSALAPKGSIYKYERQYDPSTATLFAQITGFDSIIYGKYGIEASYDRYLTPHTPPAHSIRDLLRSRTTVDNVSLTVNSQLQLQVAAALDQLAPGVLGAAAVVLDPSTGAIEAAYSNPTYDPSPLVSEDVPTEKKAWYGLNLAPGNPLRPGTYDQVYPPGSSFKVVTTSAVLQGRPDLSSMTYPAVSSVTLPNTGNPPQVLTNYHGGQCGGDLQQLVIQSCDADFAQIGQLLGAQSLVNQAQAYGFNQKVPLDVPLSASSNFGTVADFGPGGSAGAPGLMKSAIGQENVTASALQMAMVAGTVANGGVEMTPHFMSQVRDSQGNLVETYAPHPWSQPISPQTASILTGFMQGVVSNPAGTAAGVGFPDSWHVAAKTGTAQTGSFGPNPAFTDDWLIAFAPVGNQKVAIAVVLPKQPGSATGAEYSGPIVKQILGDVLADHGTS